MRNWKHYLFEFLLLFIAVTGSFWVENYREDKKEREFLRKNLGLFLEEFKTASDLRDYKDQIDSGRRNIYELASKVNKGEYDTLDHQFTVLFMGSEQLYTDFYDDILRLSDLSLLGDYSHIKDYRLIGFFQQFNDNVSTYENLVERWENSQNELENKLDEYGLTLDLERIFYKLKQARGIKNGTLYPQEIISKNYETLGDFDAFINDNEVQSVINGMVRLLIIDQEFYYSIQRQVNQSVPLIEKEMSGL